MMQLELFELCRPAIFVNGGSNTKYYVRYEQVSIEDFNKECKNEPNIEYSCPFIDHIKEVLANYQDNLSTEDFLDINRSLEKVRWINHNLREIATDRNGLVDKVVCTVDYNISAILRTVKNKLPEHRRMIDEVIKTYS